MRPTRGADRINRPVQAVILAGGRGTRLRPLTDTRPKPMLDFHGKPFAEYLVEMLRSEGFERVLFLLGYLPGVVQDHFRGGRDWGMDIQYCTTDAAAETSFRLRAAEHLLDPCFLLLYCDNYWPMPFGRMWQQFEASGAAAMVTVYTNADRYSKDNVAVGADGYVRAYDRSRRAPGLCGVEIGFAIVTRPALDLIDRVDAPFEEVVYPKLVTRQGLLAFPTGHRYYSVGSHERLPLTAAFLERRPAIILDRDGVLNERPPTAHYVRSWSDFRWKPDAREALRRLKAAGYRIVIVSNQAGVGRGLLTRKALEEIHHRMTVEAERSGGGIDAIYYCPHDWTAGCECRKPNPGLLLRAQRDLNLDLSRTVFVGDDERDAQAADAAGCPSALVSERRPLLQIVEERLRGENRVH
jgi:D-glycero-D-manno-heptose 1,7-bisphosphate phosphatase